MSQLQEAWCEVRGVTGCAAAGVGEQEIGIWPSRDEPKQRRNLPGLDVAAALDQDGVSLDLARDAPGTAQLDCFTTGLGIRQRLLRMAVVRPNRLKYRKGDDWVQVGPDWYGYGSAWRRLRHPES